ncbi:MAG: insulinase family protein [Rhodospirillaceae bacterium]|nr:insulinase family protein [Rhodospirillaceae bacterium]
MKLGSAFLIALFTAAIGLPALPEAKVFEPETFTLANGMQVVLVTDTRAPVVNHMVWYRVGSADEPTGKSGIAHFLEHLMFKGTKTLKPGEFSKIVARNGGQENAFTSQDYTGYYQTVARDRLEVVMRIEADRMANLQIIEREVIAERDVVLEERRSRVDNRASARLAEQVDAITYFAYPYRVPIIGWPDEVSRLTRDDALDFYRTWYAPNNAVLVVAGDISADALRPLAEKYYGAIPARAVPKRPRPAEPPHLTARRISLADPQVGQPSLGRRYLAPGYVHGETRHAYPLQVLSEILGGGTTSRLYRKLVVEDRIAISAGAWYGADGIGPQLFGFYLTPSQERSMAEGEAALDAEIVKILADGVTADEVARAKKRMLAEAVFVRDSVTAPARILGQAIVNGRTIADVEAWPDRVAEVTVAEVNDAARAVLILEHSVTSQLLRKGG